MYFGGIDPVIIDYIRDETKITLLLQATPNSFWSFDFGSYRFGLGSDIDKQENFDSHPLQFHLGFNGFGVPLSSYV